MQIKTKNPFLYDCFELFNQLNVSPSAKIVLFAIMSRNGFKAGLCCDKILGYRASYSDDTVQKACQELVQKGLCFFWQCPSTKRRFGGIKLSNTYYQKYSHLFHTKKDLFSIDQNTYRGVILKHDMENLSTILDSKDKQNNKYIVTASDFDISLTIIPTGYYVEFQASIIDNQSERVILINPLIKFVKSNIKEVYE